ncbi:MAG TPA: TIGR03767 family metallophosphoesterase [Actinomycetota bacterium]|nr:TIGR03767 family metallophosphoesterase [Actinomycetota bacterium]
MAPISRREFLRLAGGAAMAAPFLGLPHMAGARPDTRSWTLTTLARTIERGRVLDEGTDGAYNRLKYGRGEPYLFRGDLAEGAPPRFRRSLLNLVHYTDMQLADPQSPLRVEYLDRFSDQECEPIPFSGAFRPQEAIHFQAFEQMLRTVRKIGTSPVTGEPFQFAICTGDNIDNEHFNELQWFIGLMDGGIIDTNSGGPEFEGVQAVSWGTPDTGPDPEYWHPDPVSDKYKVQYGFPNYPGLLEQAITPFRAQGVGFPWYSCFGNHDGLIQGNFPENRTMETIAVERFKATGTPPGFNPCDEFQNLADHPEGLFAGGGRLVMPDDRRRLVSRQEYVAVHRNSPTEPKGHGFTKENEDTGTAYYFDDRYPLFRMITLDTTNPGGESRGSIGAAQLAWLEQRLIEVHSKYYDAAGNVVDTGDPSRDRLVVLFSHHGIATMDNPFVNPDPFTPEENDQPRSHGPQVERLVHRFPNVILWVNGHSHANEIRPRIDETKRNFQGGKNGFWDVTTSGICDWPTQSRLIEIIDNGNGLLSIFCTMVDHAAPPVPRSDAGIAFLASVHRELAANDPQDGSDTRRGEPADRNVDLVIQAPFPLSGAAAVARRERRRPAMAR